MKKSLLLSLFLSTLSYAQTEVVFEYDEAGNQVYRGNKSNSSNTTNNTSGITSPTSTMSPEEIAFWSNIQLAPVPVRDHLNVRITEDIKGKLNQITLHGHSSLGSTIFSIERKNIRSNEINIGMNIYPVGVYVITFHLNDGKVYSRNISKY